MNRNNTQFCVTVFHWDCTSKHRALHFCLLCHGSNSSSSPSLGQNVWLRTIFVKITEHCVETDLKQFVILTNEKASAINKTKAVQCGPYHPLLFNRAMLRKIFERWCFVLLIRTNYTTLELNQLVLNSPTSNASSGEFSCLTWLHLMSDCSPLIIMKKLSLLSSKVFEEKAALLMTN